MEYKLRLPSIVLTFDVSNVIIGHSWVRVMVFLTSESNPLYDIIITVKRYNAVSRQRRIADIAILFVLACLYRIKALPFISHEYRRNIRLYVSLGYICTYILICTSTHAHTYYVHVYIYDMNV